MPKERTINPAQAARKAEKARALKKSKAQVQTQRYEKLARRNPERLQRQIDDLKAAEASGNLRPHDRQTLAQLEKDVAAIRKAREALGDKAPQFGRPGGERREERRDGGRGSGVLGKRRRDGDKGNREDDDSSETDEDVRNIPMPRDTPPPIPRPRRERRGNANNEPLGEGPDGGPRVPHALPPKPVAQTVIEAKPVIRDLRKEATSRFVPAAVQQKRDLVKGKGRLLEPEELDKLEKEGYNAAEKAADAAIKEAEYNMMNAEAEAKKANGGEADPDALYEQFERELRHVEMEEVEDEDA